LQSSGIKCGGESSFGRSDLKLGKRADERNGVERICNVYHDEAIASGGHELWAILTTPDDGVIEVLNGLAKPHANDKERSEANHEAQQADPGGSPLNEWLVKECASFAHLCAERSECKEEEE